MVKIFQLLNSKKSACKGNASLGENKGGKQVFLQKWPKTSE